MNSQFISYKNSDIHYRYSGKGPGLVLCFHGFGTYASTFDWLGEHVPGQLFIAFDLPFHGETKWNNGELFQPEDLLQIISECPHVTIDKFALMGYSMGGRICLQLLELIPQQVTNLILLAPDGLHLNPWYWFSTQTRFGNIIFKKTMENPTPFVTMLKRGQQVRLVNRGVLKFVDRYLDNAEIRMKVYKVWTAFRKFKPAKNRIISLINEHKIPLTLIYGKYDSVIPLAPGQEFFSKIRALKNIEILETGHQVLHIRNAQIIAKAFNLPA